jgi:HEPN domain-containing protein
MVTISDARPVVDKIVNAIHPVSVSVFGSVALYGKGNDLDLLIIVDAPSEQSREIEVSIQKKLKPFYSRFPIDPFVVSREAVRRYCTLGSPFLMTALSQGKVLYMGEIIGDWLRQAHDECDMARYLDQGGYFRGACYHAQQAIEKHCKARLLKAGWQLEKTHSIQRLSAIMEQFNLPSMMDEDTIAFIDSIYRGRYSAEQGLLPMGEPQADEAAKACAIAEKLIAKNV